MKYEVTEINPNSYSQNGQLNLLDKIGFFVSEDITFLVMKNKTKRLFYYSVKNSD